MAAAAERDSVASEYATGFALTFDVGLPALTRALDAGLGPRPATVELFLTLLAAVPDTLIARKRGREAAEEVSAGAARVLAGRRTSRRSTRRCGWTATRSTPARPPTW